MIPPYLLAGLPCRPSPGNTAGSPVGGPLVILTHRRCYVLEHPGLSGLGCKRYSLGYRRLSRLLEPSQHVVGRIHAGRRLADADPQPRDILAVKGRHDVGQALVPACRPSGPKPELTRRQGYVIQNDQDVLVLNLKVPGQLTHGLAGTIHERQRREQNNSLNLSATSRRHRSRLINQPVKCLSRTIRLPAGHQRLDDPEAHIVARPGIAPTGVSQTNDASYFPGLARVHAEHLIGFLIGRSRLSRARRPHANRLGLPWPLPRLLRASRQ